jgi:hypothetical protein
MTFNFIKPSELERPFRLAVHKSGKLGFSKEAEDKLNLAGNKSIKIARNGDDENDKSLYMVVCKEEEPESFKISRSGDYFYINTKILFDNLSIDYKSGNASFDMTKLVVNNEAYWKLSRVQKEKGRQEDKDE